MHLMPHGHVNRCGSCRDCQSHARVTAETAPYRVSIVAIVAARLTSPRSVKSPKSILQSSFLHAPLNLLSTFFFLHLVFFDRFFSLGYFFGLVTPEAVVSWHPFRITLSMTSF
ncbi:hypothetical protein BJX66DRAFT_315425 [Aspergillus keveii]|uniref:Uncharacterized protein n=1 Tax=Aspergillus keveii TaxID=714993 RepID=A0ABR4FPM3_9EURO